ncbi:hypothetical protein GCM10009727_37580 [Actinomadura napierensis]|uniref:Uncharacterized protein n=1 Tax=Actinomadura napierensis TaxID=267854 RepID=A0ABN2ZDG5_9ACTN
MIDPTGDTLVQNQTTFTTNLEDPVQTRSTGGKTITFGSYKQDGGTGGTASHKTRNCIYLRMNIVRPESMLQIAAREYTAIARQRSTTDSGWSIQPGLLTYQPSSFR